MPRFETRTAVFKSHLQPGAVPFGPGHWLLQTPLTPAAQHDQWRHLNAQSASGGAAVQEKHPAAYFEWAAIRPAAYSAFVAKADERRQFADVLGEVL